MFLKWWMTDSNHCCWSKVILQSKAKSPYNASWSFYASRCFFTKTVVHKNIGRLYLRELIMSTLIKNFTFNKQQFHSISRVRLHRKTMAKTPHQFLSFFFLHKTPSSPVVLSITSVTYKTPSLLFHCTSTPISWNPGHFGQS